jgi:hypothetical protein
MCKKQTVTGRDFAALLELHKPQNRFELWTDNFLQWKEELKYSGLLTQNDYFPSFAIFGTFSRLFKKDI